jgi:FtsP/CotA-like multicopper oxidase with cupredoxin domain
MGNITIMKRGGPLIALAAVLLFLMPANTEAAIDGVTGTTFNLTATDGYISTPEGNSIYMWGYALDGGGMQYPGPTIIVNEGTTVTVNLTNQLSVPVSIVLPGHDVQATGGAAGLLTREAQPGGSVSYTFTATEPGTYLYHSGTRPDLQVEMGLVGALIVRPTLGANFAYNHADSQFDYEYLFLLTEIDPVFHGLVAFNRTDEIDNNAYWPVYWFINGRNFPDTVADAGVSYLPSQPYNCLPLMHPGDKVLLRIIGAGRDPHPFHPHGNNVRIIAENGRLLESAPGAGPDLQRSEFTVHSVPGQTVDAIFEWTGAGLGWDIYGHAPTDPLELNEYGPDHGKPFPVLLPDQKDLTFGGAWSGSPFLGFSGTLPPGEGGLNPYGAYFFPWHSHAEKEIVNNDIFIGGMLTFVLVLPNDVPIQ